MRKRQKCSKVRSYKQVCLKKPQSCEPEAAIPHSKGHEVGNGKDRKCEKDEADLMQNMFSNIQPSSIQVNTVFPIYELFYFIMYHQNNYI
jgi:hypothetical protein